MNVFYFLVGLAFLIVGVPIFIAAIPFAFFTALVGAVFGDLIDDTICIGKDFCKGLWKR